jgi:hypothetical protein
LPIGLVLQTPFMSQVTESFSEGDRMKPTSFPCYKHLGTAALALMTLLVALVSDDTRGNVGISSPASFTGPTSPLYVDNLVGQIFVIQGPSVISNFPVSAYGSQGNEMVFAVHDTVNTHGGGTSASFAGLAGQYSLSGVPTGIAYDSFPLTPGYSGELVYDGTTDGNHNYYVQFYAEDVAGVRTQDVIETDLNWQNPVKLFSLSPCGGQSCYSGIAYDPLDDSLWITGWDQGVLYKYSMSGTILGLSVLPPWTFGLAFDPADNTVWITRGNSVLEQYSATTNCLFCFLQSGVPSGLPQGNYYSIDFRVPEPGALGLLGVGLAGLGFSRRKHWPMSRQHRRRFGRACRLWRDHR